MPVYMNDSIPTPDTPTVPPSTEPAAQKAPNDPTLVLFDSLPAPLREGIQIGTQVLMAMVASPDKHTAFLGRFLIATMTMNFVEGICAAVGEQVDEKTLRNAYMVNYTATLQSMAGVRLPPEFVEAVGAAGAGIMQAYETLAQAQAQAQSPSEAPTD